MSQKPEKCVTICRAGVPCHKPWPGDGLVSQRRVGVPASLTMMMMAMLMITMVMTVTGRPPPLTAAERQRVSRARKKDAAAAASEPLERCVVSALGGIVSENTTPSQSVHELGSAIVNDLVPEDYHHLPVEWSALAGAGDLEHLFGGNLWTRGYSESAAKSKRRSLQLLPVQNGAITEEAEWMEPLAKHVQEELCKLGILGEQHVFGAMTLLLSEQGACQQSWHCDFPYQHTCFEKKFLAGDGTVPYPVSVLIAFHQDGASLRVQGAERVIDFGKFSAIVFRGDLEHAGAAWRRRDWNFRIHIYFITGGERCKQDWKCPLPRKGKTARGGNNILVCPPPSMAA